MTFSTQVTWTRKTADFAYDTYDRTHEIKFPGGIQYTASSAPEYKGNAAYINPEEGLLAALSSCHMLTFLAVAARGGYTVDRYEDSATAVLGKNEKGKLAVTEVNLKPKISFGGDKKPTDEQLATLHEKAHANCFIANSVTTKITIT